MYLRRHNYNSYVRAFPTRCQIQREFRSKVKNFTEQSNISDWSPLLCVLHILPPFHWLNVVYYTTLINHFPLNMYKYKFSHFLVCVVLLTIKICNSYAKRRSFHINLLYEKPQLTPSILSMQSTIHSILLQ